LEVLGAAAAISAPFVSDWETGYSGGNVSGLILAILTPLGITGKFMAVPLGLSVIGNTAPSIYSICFGFQTCIPPLTFVPRYILSIVATAMYVFSCSYAYKS